MGVISTVPVLDGEFWAVVLADPDLLDQAFAEVTASWHARPPSAPPGTLAAGSDWATPVPADRRARDWQPRWRLLVRAVPGHGSPGRLRFELRLLLGRPAR
jgi:hypothetical protein